MDAEKGKRGVCRGVNDALYSGTSDKGHSEIGTTSLQSTLVSTHANTLVYYLTSEIGTTSLQVTNHWSYGVRCSEVPLYIAMNTDTRGGVAK